MGRVWNFSAPCVILNNDTARTALQIAVKSRLHSIQTLTVNTGKA
ncbi:hypothetical protein SDC9_105246 [bioreactor metagenome]|uniref:Uncharacterized protein n=1 Tax=bioreactor metagenome TaxID=1076179 RepID=A0A645AYT8_9ZZZZ